MYLNFKKKLFLNNIKSSYIFRETAQNYLLEKTKNDYFDILIFKKFTQAY